VIDAYRIELAETEMQTVLASTYNAEGSEKAIIQIARTIKHCAINNQARLRPNVLVKTGTLFMAWRGGH
jgi:hypothetical protein